MFCYGFAARCPRGGVSSPSTWLCNSTPTCRDARDRKYPTIDTQTHLNTSVDQKRKREQTSPTSSKVPWHQAKTNLNQEHRQPEARPQNTPRDRPRCTNCGRRHPGQCRFKRIGYVSTVTKKATLSRIAPKREKLVPIDPLVINRPQTRGQLRNRGECMLPLARRQKTPTLES